MNKKLALIFIVGISLFLTACQQNDNSGPGDSFIGGNQGLSISFVEQAPPDQVADSGEQVFDVVVELENEGEAEIPAEDVTVTLEGFSPQDFGKTVADLTKSPEEDIQANREIPGEDRIIESPPVFTEFTGFVYEESAQTNLPYTVQARACYSYETQAAASLCIGENLNRPDLNEVCDLSNQNSPDNSGAPVKVKQFSQSPGGSDSVRFSFTVENVGNGDVFRTNSKCDTSRRNTDQVFVSINGLEDAGEVSCTGLREGTSASGFTRLADGGSSEVYCSLDIPENRRNNRIENFIINVGYDYEQTIQKQIEVRHTLE